MNRKAYNMKIYLHIFLIGVIIELCIYDMIPRSFSEIAYPAWTNTYFINITRNKERKPIR